MRLQDRAGIGSVELARFAQDLIRELNGTGGVRNAFTTFQTGTPQVFVDVDRVKAQMLRVSPNAIFEAMRIYMGSAYVNDINLFGRTYRVQAQADGEFRLDADNVSRIRVRNLDGQMVPLGSLVTFREIAGPDRVPRYNLFPTVEVQGAPPRHLDWTTARHRGGGLEPGSAGGCRLRVDRSVVPGEAGRSYRLLYFALSVLFVFLALAAQYESWSLPLAILLIVPMCLLSALFGVWMHSLDINILTQIAFVVLIGLAAKNAILIVEFARQIEEQGKDIVTAAVEACQLRVRPILMTSLAFALGDETATDRDRLASACEAGTAS